MCRQRKEEKMLWLIRSHYVPLYCQHDINISKLPQNQHFSKSTPTKRLLCRPPCLLSHRISVLANALIITELGLAAWRIPTAPNQQLQVLIYGENLTKGTIKNPKGAGEQLHPPTGERDQGDGSTYGRLRCLGDLKCSKNKDLFVTAFGTTAR